MKHTDAEVERQYLLLVTAAAVRARLLDAGQIHYTINHLQRVVDRASQTGHDDIATIAQGELDVARRLNEESPVQQAAWTRRAMRKPRIQDDCIVIGDVPETALELTFSEANSLRAELGAILAVAGGTGRDTL